MANSVVNNNSVEQESTNFQMMLKALLIHSILSVIGKEFWKLVLMPSYLVGLLEACIMER